MTAHTPRIKQMLNNNSNKIRSVKGYQLLQAGGKKGRPKLLHNGLGGNKGGTNTKGTAKAPGKTSPGDQVTMAVRALKKKKK
jgi:hypothetical protein